MKAAGGDPDLGLPELDGGDYLIKAWMDLDLCSQTMGGDLPISWQEIEAFSRCTNAVSQTWEFRVLREMSVNYVKEKQQATSPLYIPPTSRGEDDD